MMKLKSFHAMAFASIVVVSIISASAIFVTAESGEMETSKKESSVPRYSETCAHGHNGFGCDSPQYKKDILDLQEKVSVLEQRASRP